MKYKLSDVPGLQSGMAKNFISLGSLQIVNFLLPLLLTPYLVRVLGIENFGLIALSQAVISFFMIMTDYGFNLTATRAIAISRTDKKVVGTIFNQAISTKLMLTAAGLLLLAGGLLLLQVSVESIKLYLFTYMMVVGQAMLPLWFFQGMEDMKYITFFSLFTKLVSVFLILLFVKHENDYIYVNLFHGIGTIVAGLFSFYLIKKKFNIGFTFTTSIKQQLKEGWHIFTSNFMINIYMSSNIIILGLFAGKEVVGYFSVAEKVINATRQLLVVFFQVTYPQVCNLAVNTQDLLRSFFKRIFIPFIALILIASAGIFLLSDYIVLFFTGQFNPNISLLLRILSFVPFIVALNIPANQLLLAYNQKKVYSNVFVVCSVVNVLINSILSYYYQATGTAIAIVMTEILVTTALYLALKYKNPSFSVFDATKNKSS